MKPSDRLMDRLLSTDNVAAAWRWLCRSRRNFPPHADIWHLRFHRATALPSLLGQLRSGQFRFSPMQTVTRADGETLALWSAADALVLKMMTGILQDVLPVHRACSHVKGHGGHKAAVRRVDQWVAGGAYAFVCRTDIRGYYANIDQSQLLDLLSRPVRCPVMLDLLARFLDYCVESGGLFHTPRKGIPRGCPLSPLLAGFHLHEIDSDLGRRRGVRYVRFMDDLLILARSRWQLKGAVATMNRWFTAAGLEQHPDKTFIGRVGKGFDWLGYRFGARGLCGIAAPTLDKFAVKLCRLFEQARRDGTSGEGVPRRVAEYIRRWLGWALGNACYNGGSDAVLQIDLGR